jgi:hypothetical protein
MPEAATKLSEREVRQLYKLLGKFHDALNRDNEDAQRQIIRIVRLWTDNYGEMVLNVDVTEKR